MHTNNMSLQPSADLAMMPLWLWRKCRSERADNNSWFLFTFSEIPITVVKLGVIMLARKPLGTAARRLNLRRNPFHMMKLRSDSVTAFRLHFYSLSIQTAFLYTQGFKLHSYTFPSMRKLHLIDFQLIKQEEYILSLCPSISLQILGYLGGSLARPLSSWQLSRLGGLRIS